MNKYLQLDESYKEIYSLIDHFIFNSSVSQSVYMQHVENVKGEVVPVVHSGIGDHRSKMDIDENNIHIGFIGNTTVYKGYPLLERVLVELLDEGFANWSLSVWGGAKAEHPNTSKILFRGTYTPSQLGEVYSPMNLLVVPSVWKETFSLVALEALSHGVPVLVSSTVGAKDVIKQYDSSFIFESRNDLKENLKMILMNPHRLSDFNEKILNRAWIYTQREHTQQIRDIYNKIIKQKSVNK